MLHDLVTAEQSHTTVSGLSVHSVILSVHFFRCLPLCRMPSTDLSSTVFASPSSDIRQICPKINNFLHRVVSTVVSFLFTLCLIVSFEILCLACSCSISFHTLVAFIHRLSLWVHALMFLQRRKPFYLFIPIRTYLRQPWSSHVFFCSVIFTQFLLLKIKRLRHRMAFYHFMCWCAVKKLLNHSLTHICSTQQNRKKQYSILHAAAAAIAYNSSRETFFISRTCFHLVLQWFLCCFI